MTTTRSPSPLRRHRAAVIIGIGLLAAVVLAIVGGNGNRTSGVADPDNPGADGAQALARVLANEGVEVRVVRGADELDDTALTNDTTVVVTSTERLGPSTLQRLMERAGNADVIAVEPRFGAAELFGVAGSSSVVERTTARGDCADLSLSDLRINVATTTTYPAGPTSCFRVDAGAILVSPAPGLTVMGSTDLISNEQITRADNAAVALRLFGQHGRLVWYVPDVADLAGADGVSLSSLLPRWLRPGLVVCAISMLSVLWWRGRRLGRLVVEPLPVAVTAIETTRSRARLYRKVNDRAHAADALRRAARRRIADQLGLPRSTGSDATELIRDVAPYTTLGEARLFELLAPHGSAPDSDHDLIHLANDLADLMREVRRS